MGTRRFGFCLEFVALCFLHTACLRDGLSLVSLLWLGKAMAVLTGSDVDWSSVRRALLCGPTLFADADCFVTFFCLFRPTLTA